MTLLPNDCGRMWPRSRELPSSGPKKRQRVWPKDAPHPKPNRAPPRSWFWFTYEAFIAAEQMFGQAIRGPAPALRQLLARLIPSVSLLSVVLLKEARRRRTQRLGVIVRG